MKSFGPYVPIIRTETDIVLDASGIVSDFTYVEPIKRRLAGEILPDDSVIVAPSLVSQFVLKKGNTYEETPETESKKNRRQPNDYIKEAIISNLTNKQGSILAIDDYYGSSAGQLLYTLGVSLVSEYNLDEKLRKISHRMRRGDTGLTSEFDTTKEDLIAARKNNAPFKLKGLHRCPHCSFGTRFSFVLDQHLEAPHQNAKFHSCNWCNFKTKDSTQIIYHNHIAHQKYRCMIEKPLQVHCCRYCKFETNSKRKFSSHIRKCEPSFKLDSHLCPEQPDDFPAITHKGLTQIDIKTYDLTLKTLRLAAYNPHQIKVNSAARGKDVTPILLIPRSSPAASILDQLYNQQRTMTISEATSPFTHVTSVINPDGIRREDRVAEQTGADKPVSSNLLRLLAINSSTNPLPNTSTSVLVHPRPQSAFVNGMSATKSTQDIIMPPPSRDLSFKRTVDETDLASPVAEKRREVTEKSKAESSTDNDEGGTFVICEICDAYIDNINSFRSHMHKVHKVKIHSKVLETLKPPLNCQKCNWRYFTDQGLERHLLGSHGLITSNLQELADQDKDSGRCTICGARCSSKLVSHIREIHKVSLKPAQLAYKCTVCAATFCLYRHFENHVYKVHSGC